MGQKTSYRRKVQRGLGLLSSSTASAENDFKEAINENPHLPDAYMGMGLLAKSTNNFEQCVVHLSKALSVNPTFTPIYTNITRISLLHDFGECLTNEGQLSRAKKLYQSIVSNEDFYSYLAHRKLGEIHLIQNNPPAAIRSFSRAIGPNKEHWLYFLAVAYEREGSLTLFTKAMKAALERDPQQRTLRLFDFMNTQERYYFLGLASTVQKEGAKALFFFNRFIATSTNLELKDRAAAHINTLKESDFGQHVAVDSTSANAGKTIKSFIEQRLPKYATCVSRLPDLFLDVRLSQIKSKALSNDLTMANDHRIRIVQTETTTATANSVEKAKACVYQELKLDFERINQHSFRNVHFSIFSKGN